MNLEVDTKAKALYIRLGHGRVANTVELAEMVVSDVDESGRPLGLEFVHARDFAPFLQEHPDVAAIPSRLPYTSVDRHQSWEIETGVAHDGRDAMAERLMLNGEFIAEILGDPESLTTIPEGATVVLLPYPDPARVLGNVALAMRQASNGEAVYLRRIGAPTNVRSEAPIFPYWAANWGAGARLALEYDRDRGTLTVDFSGGQRDVIRFPVAEKLALLIDRETREVVGYAVPMPPFEGPREAARGAFEASDSSYRVTMNTPDAYAALTEDLAPRAA